MAYFKIGTIDFSPYVSELKVNRSANYNVQTNAAGDTVVDYINHKRTIEVEIIPLTAARMTQIQGAISDLSVSISFLNPKTNTLENDVNCIIPENNVEYYTIQTNKTLLNEMKLKFIEL